MWTNRQKRLGLWISAAVLAAGKGWVLAMLAMLAAKRRLRVAARGSGPGAKRRRPCPPLRAAAPWTGRDEGRPDHQPVASGQGRTRGWTKEARQAREGGCSIRGRRFRVGVLWAVLCRTPEQVPPACLDGSPGMACHRLPGPGVLPKRNSGKAQDGGDGRQDQAADSPAPGSGPSLPGQHPSPQVTQVLAHSGSLLARIFRVGRGFGYGKSGIVRCRPARTWPANALGAPYSGFGALSVSRLPLKR